MNRDKLFFRYVLLHYFDLKKTAAETHRLLSEMYGDETPSERTCRVWFERFRSGDFNVRGKERSTAFYRRGITLLSERWEIVIENGGNYFD